MKLRSDNEKKMSKRSSDGNEKTSKAQKKDSVLKKSDEPIITPCTTPATRTTPAKIMSKNNFQFWKKTEPEGKLDPISTSKLKFGIWFVTFIKPSTGLTSSCLVNLFSLNAPIKFRVSFKCKKNASKNGDMFTFHIADEDGEMQVTAFPQQTIDFFDLIQVLSHTFSSSDAS